MRDRSLAVHFFSAIISRQTYAGTQLESLATKLTVGALAPMIAHLVKHQKVSRDEIERLRSILDDPEIEEDQA